MNSSTSAASRQANWNQAVAQLATRADVLDDPVSTFVDTIFLDALKARQNQIVYGRRGTGKTHLFRRLEAELVSRFGELRYLPIYVNGSRLRQHAKMLYDEPSAIALSFYIEFINVLSKTIYEFIESQINASLWDKLVGGTNTTKAKRARFIAESLYTLLREGQVRILPAGTASTEVRTVNEALEKASASGGVSLNLADPRSIGWKVGLDAGVSSQEQHTDVSMLKLQGDVILPFNEVSLKLQELLKLLDNASFVILFDEWSDVNLAAQPYLADMIKRTLATLDQMHVKLGCVPGRTLLATPITEDNRMPIGFEEGDDISADIDLDQVVFVDNDLQQLLTFFLVLLKKHVGVSLPWVREMEDEDFTRFLFNEIFQGEAAFAEICQASAGVPRDFLNLLHTASGRPTGQRGKISLYDVRVAAKSLYQSKRRSFMGADSEQLKLLDEIYRMVVANKRSYFFLVREDLVEQPNLGMLFTERLIHRIPVSFYDESAHKRYEYFMIDYGVSVDLLITKTIQARREKRSPKPASAELSSGIVGFNPVSWIGKAISKTSFGESFSRSLAQVQEDWDRKMDILTVSMSPKGRLDVDPRELIVDELIERTT